MIYLLDTHIFIWTTLETDKLSENCKNIISNKNNEICVSTVSFWEIALKTGMKKFSFKNVNIKKFPQLARDMDLTIIDMQENEAITFHELPLKENHCGHWPIMQRDIFAFKFLYTVIAGSDPQSFLARRMTGGIHLFGQHISFGRQDAALTGPDHRRTAAPHTLIRDTSQAQRYLQNNNLGPIRRFHK